MAINQFLSLPAAAAAGIAPASSSSAWAFGSPVTISAALPNWIKVIGIQFQNTDTPAVDVNQDILFEVTVDGATKLQIPFNMKADSLVGYHMTSGASIESFYLPEPYLMPGGTAVAVKVTDSIAAALTYSGFKLIYQEIATPLIETLIDNFNDNSINTGLWKSDSYSATIAETGSQLVITPTNNTAGDGGELDSVATYNLTGSALSVKVVQVTNGTCNTTVMLSADADNSVLTYTEDGSIYAAKIVSGTQTNLANTTYNSTTMAYWRIREASGTTYWDYSADASSWTNLYSVSNPITVTSVVAKLLAYEWEAVNPVGAAIFDDVNITSTNAAITQVYGSMTLSGGTQVIAATQIASASVSQVYASAALTGGTQSVSTVRNVSISQIATALALSGGTQTVDTTQYASVAQVAANLILSGGTQTISTVNNASITQVAGEMTLSGGTQTVDTVNNVSITQVAGELLLTGGTQSITSGSVSNASISQVAANLTITTGTQAVSAAQNASITQVSADLSLTGGTQSIDTQVSTNILQLAGELVLTGGAQDILATVTTSASITQVAGELTLSGGTQTLASQVNASVAQIAAQLSLTGGTQEVTGIVGLSNANITQVAANLTLTGGTQITSINSSPLPPVTPAYDVIWVDGELALQLDEDQYILL